MLSLSLWSWSLPLASLPILLVPLGYLLLYPRSRPSFQHSHHRLDTPPSDDDDDLDPLPSVLAPAYTTHARLHPIPSKHAFSYPLLYLGADVDALEAGRLNLPYRVLKYGGTSARVLGLRSGAYLMPDVLPGADEGTQEREEASKDGAALEGKKVEGLGLRGKVEKLLSEYGFGKEELGRMWMLTMPSFLGFEGINPLTVWYIYRRPSITDDEGEEAKHGTEGRAQSRRELLAVILEVHNTFGEKHAYVLPTTSSFTVPPKEGYSHAWTFPRGFHVSPFNSRDGFYTLDLLDPFISSSTPTISTTRLCSGPESTKPPPTRESCPDPYPNFKVFLRLLTPSRQTKLHALLASSPSPSSPPIPLQSDNVLAILKTLARWPLALIATTPRILYQAYRLHYERKLAVYPRPEPGPGVSEQDAGDDRPSRGEASDNSDDNPPNPDAGISGQAIGWQGLGGMEGVARGVVERYLQHRFSAQIGQGEGLATRTFRVEFTYPAPACIVPPPSRSMSISPSSSASASASSSESSTPALRDIIIRTADQKFFTHLLLLPSPLLVLTLFPELGTHIEQRDHADFIALFSSDSRPTETDTPTGKASSTESPTSSTSDRFVSSQVERLQRAYMLHLFSHSTISPEPRHMTSLPSPHRTGRSRTSSISSFSSTDRIRVLLIITLAAWADWAEERIMYAVGARFVEGQEPWKVWERALRRQYRAEDSRRYVRDSGREEVVDEGPGVGEDWELARVESGSSAGDAGATTRPKAIEENGGGREGDWVDLGSVRYV